MHQRTGDVQAPFHAAREGAGLVASAVRQADQRQHLLAAPVQLGTRDAVERAEDFDIGAGGQFLIERQVLRHEAKGAACSHAHRSPG